MSDGGHLTRHRDEQLVENARFMLENGEHRERVAQRLGISLDGLEKALSRAKERERKKA